MSEFRIDQIKSQDASRGPDIAGITTFTGTSGIVMPSGRTSGREAAQFGNENIVTDRLYFHIDSKYSYPSKISHARGAYMIDLAGTNDIFIEGNTAYDSDDSGGIFKFRHQGSSSVVDAGIAERIVIPGNTPRFSVTFWYQLTGGTNGGRGGLFERKPSTYYNGWTFGQGGSSNWSFNVGVQVNSSTDYYNTQFPFPPSHDGTTWYCDSVSVDRTMGLRTNITTPYRNGIDISDQVTLVTAGTWGIGNMDDGGLRTPMTIGRRPDNSSPISLPMKLGAVQIYNKVLTAKEHLQNFNALKTRFGY